LLVSRYYYYTYATYCSACDNLILGELAEAELAEAELADLGQIISIYYTLQNLISPS
jgi:hypothetical protein